MFKSGDKVVCINRDYRKKFNLTNKLYNVSSFIKSDKTIYQHDLIILDNERYGHYAKYFLTLKEYRKEKLIKLCSSQVIK